MTDEFKNRLNELAETVSKRLDGYMERVISETKGQRRAAEAMKYSLSAGGKRIRPVLTAEFCRVCGGGPEDAFPAACALEMIHTFSLIHDDLPCMDDDDMRRGKPSCHAAFGEATALLAGDALLNLAYEVILDGGLPPETKLALIAELSAAVGMNGMIGGQVIDTVSESGLSEAALLEMYSMKTGALLRAACKTGCIAAGADGEKIAAAALYAEKLGLAFQIIDDILDVEGDEKLLGKPTGSDRDNEKVTYAALNGIENSRKTAETLTNEALEALNAFEDNVFLKELTLYLLKRDH
ncbi:MAG: polyprenyl synthetase family protein [Prevotella sp.]|nr:polyprenyl synthetase family protein [Prevotella sp.]